ANVSAKSLKSSNHEFFTAKCAEVFAKDTKVLNQKAEIRTPSLPRKLTPKVSNF
ncbi:MAG: hypothetical protein ACI9ZX_002629, partial [Algoriphagus sp.]